MSDSNLSGLPSAAAPSNTDLFYTVQGTTPLKQTWSALVTAINTLIASALNLVTAAINVSLAQGTTTSNKGITLSPSDVDGVGTFYSPYLSFKWSVAAANYESRLYASDGNAVTMDYYVNGVLNTSNVFSSFNGVFSVNNFSVTNPVGSLPVSSGGLKIKGSTYSTLFYVTNTPYTVNRRLTFDLPNSNVTLAMTGNNIFTGVTVGSGTDLKLGNAYVAGVVVPTGTLNITDSTGQVYRVPCLI